MITTLTDSFLTSQHETRKRPRKCIFFSIFSSSLILIPTDFSSLENLKGIFWNYKIRMRYTPPGLSCGGSRPLHSPPLLHAGGSSQFSWPRPAPSPVHPAASANDAEDAVNPALDARQLWMTHWHLHTQLLTKKYIFLIYIYIYMYIYRDKYTFLYIFLNKYIYVYISKDIYLLSIFFYIYIYV